MSLYTIVLCMCACMCFCMCALVCVCICLCLCLYVCLCLQLCVWSHILYVCLLRHVSQRVSLIVIPGFLFVCLFVCLSVCHFATYSRPRLIDHNQIWCAGTYLSSHPCKPFWIPCPPYFGSSGQKYANFRLWTTLNGYHLDIRTQIKKKPT